LSGTLQPTPRRQLPALTQAPAGLLPAPARRALPTLVPSPEPTPLSPTPRINLRGVDVCGQPVCEGERIVELPDANPLEPTDYIAVDSDGQGTRRTPISDLGSLLELRRAVFVQATPVDNLFIVHNLGRLPVCTLLDSNGRQMLAQLEIDENTVIFRAGSPVAFTLILL